MLFINILSIFRKYVYTRDDGVTTFKYTVATNNFLGDDTTYKQKSKGVSRCFIGKRFGRVVLQLYA